MVELTNEEEANLGTGVAFSSRFDAVEYAGSVDLIDGFDVVARDLSFGTRRELDKTRGDLPDAEFAEEVRVTVRDDVVAVDSRIERIVGDIDVNLDESPTAVSVELTVEAVTGERGDLVLPIAE
jgi:hypothetical protein